MMVSDLCIALAVFGGFILLFAVINGAVNLWFKIFDK